ncbi:unnamed protein product [Mytilus coruscus]|uniref:Uncharacterized protein n=1 Tax=Mytilus coruscus TaxID=42192 RepID=A0A6J8E2B4_MYTCO|nr:unnamed protein product [Mytilus coruscus]
MQTLTHLHIFSSQASQDAAVTTPWVMTDVVQDLKTILPNLQNVHIFSDNAGCYKSSLTLSTLRHEIGKALASYNFSEAQNGKGPCDRRAAHAKFVIKRFINEGRDVTSALDMKKALEKLDKKIQRKLVQWDSLKPSKNAVQLKVISDWTDIAISDSYEASEEMRSGHLGFSKDEFLTGQQIGSYFCRLAQQDRNSDSNDYRAADEENRRSILKKEITKTIDI